MSYKVILDTGMSGREVSLPDANAWSINDGFLKVGDGDIENGEFRGERHATFNWDNVCAIIDMDMV